MLVTDMYTRWLEGAFWDSWPTYIKQMLRNKGGGYTTAVPVRHEEEPTGVMQA